MWRSRLQRAIAPDALPQCIVYPDTVDALAAVMTCAHEHQWRVLPCGNGTKLHWGPALAGADVVVSTARLNRVVEHAIGDLTLTVEAGASFGVVQAQLAIAQQWLALDPTFPEGATLGGIVATADAGSLRQRYGGVRDMLIGLTLVRHDGQLAKAGGRVVKNVAGYDLMKLMTGSYGTLGVLAQLTFRTYPVQETSQTVVMQGAAATIQAIAAAMRLSSLTPVALDLLTPDLMQALGFEARYGLAAQFQSIAAGVQEQVDRCLAIAHDHTAQTQVLPAETEAAVWANGAKHVVPAPDAPPPALLLKVGIPPSDAIAQLSALIQIFPESDVYGRIHASSGIGLIRVDGAALTPDWVAKARSHLEGSGGYCTVLDCAAVVPTNPWGIAPDTARLMTRIRAQFDPSDRLSPGRFAAH